MTDKIQNIVSSYQQGLWSDLSGMTSSTPHWTGVEKTLLSELPRLQQTIWRLLYLRRDYEGLKLFKEISPKHYPSMGIRVRRLGAAATPSSGKTHVFEKTFRTTGQFLGNFVFSLLIYPTMDVLFYVKWIEANYLLWLECKLMRKGFKLKRGIGVRICQGGWSHRVYWPLHGLKFSPRGSKASQKWAGTSPCPKLLRARIPKP